MTLGPNALGHSRPEDQVKGPGTSVRRYDIDWLRVLLFGLLIPFHAALGFLPEGQYVYGVQNEPLAGKSLGWLLDASHGFRLHALFMISGVGTWFVLRRRSLRSFLVQRAIRLGVPLAAGVLTVNQATFYLIASQYGADVFSLSFVPAFFTENSARGVFMHLWFLVNLIVYSAVFAPLFILLRTPAGQRFTQSLAHLCRVGSGLGMVLVLPIPMILTTLASQPLFYGGTGEGFKLPLYGWFFVLGFLSMQIGAAFYEALIRWWSYALAAGLAVGLGRLSLIERLVTDYPRHGWMLDGGGWARAIDQPPYAIGLTIAALTGLYPWLMCVGIFGAAARYLNGPSKILAELNRLVYPLFIFHFLFCTIGIIAAANLTVPWPLEFLVVTIFAFCGALALSLIAAQSRLGRLAFGISEAKPKPTALSSAAI